MGASTILCLSAFLFVLLINDTTAQLRVYRRGDDEPDKSSKKLMRPESRALQEHSNVDIDADALRGISRAYNEVIADSMTEVAHARSSGIRGRIIFLPIFAAIGSAILAATKVTAVAVVAGVIGGVLGASIAHLLGEC